MVVIEFILELITRFFVEIILKGLILGLWKLMQEAMDFFKYSIIGLKKTDRWTNPVREAEKKIAFQKT